MKYYYSSTAALVYASYALPCESRKQLVLMNTHTQKRQRNGKTQKTGKKKNMEKKRRFNKRNDLSGYLK